LHGIFGLAFCSIPQHAVASKIAFARKKKTMKNTPQEMASDQEAMKPKPQVGKEAESTSGDADDFFDSYRDGMAPILRFMSPHGGPCG